VSVGVGTWQGHALRVAAPAVPEPSPSQWSIIAWPENCRGEGAQMEQDTGVYRPLGQRWDLAASVAMGKASEP
jgi:hypothetical protein